MKCNLCELEIDVALKSSALIDHMKQAHKDIYYLHKDNPDANVGFRVEFLQVNELKSNDGDENDQSVILGEECEAMVSEVVGTTEIPADSDVVNMQYVVMGPKRKLSKVTSGELYFTNCM